MNGHDKIIIVFLFRSIVGGGGGGAVSGGSGVGSLTSDAAVGVVADVGDDEHAKVILTFFHLFSCYAAFEAGAAIVASASQNERN